MLWSGSEMRTDVSVDTRNSWKFYDFSLILTFFVEEWRKRRMIGGGEERK
jgi:hypothetical protein